MKYKVVASTNPQRRGDLPKWYANSVNTDKMTIKDFSKEISDRSSLTRGDIENVISNFLDELPTFLKVGMSVKLGDFGTLRLTLSSEGVDSKEEFTYKNIKNVHIVFTPGSELKKALEDVRFEEEK
jgi:predicted histone-like DNA-binding protein